jgi:hypothetical protein
MIHNPTDNYQPDPQPDVHPGTTPSAFRVPCPNCGILVVFPFDPVRSAMLDELLCIREYLEALAGAQEVMER